MATTRVRVDPKGTMPDTGAAHGPFPAWISIQQSTLSPMKKVTSLTIHKGHCLNSKQKKNKFSFEHDGIEKASCL